MTAVTEQRAELADETVSAGEDARIVAYWDLLCRTPEHATLNVIATRAASAALITAAIAEHDHRNGVDREARRAAAPNPSTPKELLLELVHGSYGYTCAHNAARNPAIGTEAELLHTYPTVHHDVAAAALANPGVSGTFIAEHWRRNPAAALMNRRCSVDIIDECCGDGTNPELLISLLGNRDAPARYVDSAVGHPDDAVRAAAARHLRHTVGDLDAIEAAERARIDTSQRVLNTITRARRRIRYRETPYTTQVQRLTQLQYNPVFAAELLAETTAGVAARRLITAGFEGTIAELLVVAGTFTH